ncbi:VirB8/TrbF family protein [Paraburkholderia humisilvae]|uniref:Bacterial virulence protein VirB8 domain-containing protein n=1 Tax=Paraburkholderia humisilvae TaxID=627669 RepID=A0A6J5EW79_9BURK|nr:VirB8/TrbF family protein [Paraburkholderia humisilvae]CAB3770830.1 hypothetical protein LMG29542_06455 [Paraburkholderia humisilvae]
MSSPLTRTRDEQPAPPGTGAGADGWFAAFQKPVWERRLAVKCAALFAAIAMGECVALVQMARSSGPKPYFVEHDEKSGAAWVTNRYASEYSPTAANRRYFLIKWASRVFTISADSQATIQRQLPAAASWTSGAATNELETYTQKTDPIAERVVTIPGLTREFVENSTSFSPDGRVAYVIFTSIESVNGKAGPPQQRLLTVNFLTDPSLLKDGEEKDNPIGLRITHFTVTPYKGYNPGSAE